MKSWQLSKGVATDLRNLVVIQTHVDQALGEGVLIQLADLIAASLQGLKAKVVEAVKVTQISYPVVADVKPDQRTGNEGIVKPLNLVTGHIQPVEVGQVGDEAIEIDEVVLIQSECLKLFHVLECCPLNDVQVVPSNIKHVESGGNVCKGSIAELVDLVASKAQAVQGDEPGEAAIFNAVDLIVCQVKHFQMLTILDERGQ